MESQVEVEGVEGLSARREEGVLVWWKTGREVGRRWN